MAPMPGDGPAIRGDPGSWRWSTAGLATGKAEKLVALVVLLLSGGAAIGEPPPAAGPGVAAVCIVALPLMCVATYWSSATYGGKCGKACEKLKRGFIWPITSDICSRVSMHGLAYALDMLVDSPRETVRRTR